jgi:glucose/arabinose dehydrogenase
MRHQAAAAVRRSTATFATVRGPVRTRTRIVAGVIGAVMLLGMLPGAGAAAPMPPPTVGETSTPAAPSASSIRLTRVAAGLSKPVFITSARDGTGRLFIVEKTGAIRILSGGSVLSTPLINLSGSVSQGSEQGLLGLAFHPRFKTNRKFYVDYTNRSGTTVIREYRVSATNPNRVQKGSGRTILTIRQPYSNHNGGMIAFGPDGYLYIGTGDGGSGGDPGNRAQRKDTLLGKMLRINVNAKTATRNYTIPRSNPYVGKTGRNEIWQRGLRNPWRFSFDRATGNLWIGDVGQNRYEEIDRAVRTSTGAGRGFNWGWRVMEGFHCYRPATGCNKAGKRRPLLNYSHASNGRCAVTGGYVYRGSRIAALRGWYVFGDYCSGEIFTVPANASSKPAKVRLHGTGGGLVSSFGESANGELFVVYLGGSIYRIDPA